MMRYMLALRKAVAIFGADLDCSSDYSIGRPLSSQLLRTGVEQASLSTAVEHGSADPELSDNFHTLFVEGQPDEILHEESLCPDVLSMAKGYMVQYSMAFVSADPSVGYHACQR